MRKRSPPLVALDAFECRIMDADLLYAAKAAAIREHRDQIARQLAELGISEMPMFVKKAVRRYARHQGRPRCRLTLSSVRWAG